MSKTKIVLAVIGAFLALGLVFTFLGLAFGWIGAGAKVVSADNVRTQHAVVIGHFNAMDASAKNACTVQKSATGSSDRSPTLVEDPMLAYSATFNSIAADYNSAVDNNFKAGIVAPSGYPESVYINSIDTEDWCTVSKQLQNMRDQ